MQSKVELSYTTLPHLPAVAAVGFSTCLAAEAAALVTLTFGAGWAVVCNTAREINPRDSKFNKELHSGNNWKITFYRNQKSAPAVIRALPEWTGLGGFGQFRAISTAWPWHPGNALRDPDWRWFYSTGPSRYQCAWCHAQSLRNASRCSLPSESTPFLLYRWSFLE